MSTTLAPQRIIKPYLVNIDLRPLGDGETLITTPKGTLFEVAVAPQQVSSWLQLCNGQHDLQAIEAQTDPGFLEIIEALREDGCMLDSKPELEDASWASFAGDLQIEKLQQQALTLFASDSLAAQINSLDLLARFGDVTLKPLQHIDTTLEQEADTQAMFVVVLDHYDGELLLKMDRYCSHHQMTWAAFHLDRGKGWLGPLVVPGKTADYTDLSERRLCCADNKRMYEAITAKAIEIPSPRPLAKASLAWMLGRFFFELERFVVGADCGLLSTELEADPNTLAFTVYSYLPMPHKTIEGTFLTSAKPGVESLINPRSGLIVQSIQVKHHPSVPDTLVTMQAQVTNIAARYDAANDVIVGGSCFNDRQQALMASVGETIERYCGNYIPGEELRRATYAQIVAGGEHALDPDSLILFDEAMYREKGCPMVPFTRDTEVLWVRGRSLTKDTPAWLPISLVYVNWYTALPEEPITNYMNFPGIAAGQNDEHAIVSAIEEIVERDATMIWWMNRQPLAALQLPDNIRSVWTKSAKDQGQRAWAIYLENEFQIPVVAGILENTKDGLFNIGFASRPHVADATLKAWTEALTLQEGSRDMDDPNGLLRTSVEEWGLIEVPYKPWRKDRRYLDDYRSDFRDVSDLLQQQQVNLDPRCLEQVRAWVDTPRTRTLESIPALADRSLNTYQSRIEACGYEIFYKDITTNDVALTGLKAARVIIPGLAPNTPAAFPPLGKGRIQQAAVDLGWRKEPLKQEELNYAPLPHA